MPARREMLVKLALTLLGGLLLRWSFGLQPLSYLAWVAPAPLLLAVLRSTRRAALGWALLGGLVAASANLHYYSLVMPLPTALLVMLLSALLWVAVLANARRVMLGGASPWRVLAYPLLWCAADTLLAHLHPDGNWGSLAYSQAGLPLALQLVSLLGTAGLVFVLSLVPAALAFAAHRGLRAARWPLAGAGLALAACLGFGLARIPPAAPAQGAVVGMAVIDDFIGPRTPQARVEAIWAQYERHVAALAGQGARLVLLPEKIAVLAPPAAQALRNRMATLAARSGAWLAVGVGVDGQRVTNHLWLFAPDGSLAADYLKQHLAPPERGGYAAGAAYAVQKVDGLRYGLAVCKDAHFAETGRAYAGLQAQALLVPAWDFGEDGRYAARQSAVRGVESGMAMLRASREGLLSVTDAYGRVLAETPSAPLPGATLLARMPAELPPSTLPGTLYARTGDLFGWLCTAAALAMVALARRRRGSGAAAVQPSLPVSTGSP